MEIPKTLDLAAGFAQGLLWFWEEYKSQVMIFGNYEEDINWISKLGKLKLKTVTQYTL